VDLLLLVDCGLLQMASLYFYLEAVYFLFYLVSFDFTSKIIQSNSTSDIRPLSVFGALHYFQRQKLFASLCKIFPELEYSTLNQQTKLVSFLEQYVIDTGAVKGNFLL